uniref:Uncharacterized protein n=1 Tax=Anguilla anguilla TaxID=7936 RepID=A0A0E9UBD3_ANGAN
MTIVLTDTFPIKTLKVTQGPRKYKY